MEHCIVWLRDLETKKIGLEVFGELRNSAEGEWRRYNDQEVTIVEILGSIGENRAILYIILLRCVFESCL